MKFRLPLLLLALLLLAAPVKAQPDLPPTFNLRLQAALASGQIDTNAALRWQHAALFAPNTLPPSLRPSQPERSGSAALRHLDQSGQLEMPIGYTPRPTLSAARVFDSAYIRVHYTLANNNAPPAADENGNGVPDYVESIAFAAEKAWQVLVETLAWPPPLADGDLGGDGRTDIYVLDLGQTYLGWTARDNRGCGDHPATPQQEEAACPAFLAIDNRLRGPGLSPAALIDITVAHEFMHVLQYGLDSVESSDWLWEAWAVWAEEQVFDEIDAYLQFLPPLFAAPEASFETLPYAAALIPLWLSEHYGPALVREVWTDTPQEDGLYALSAVIGRHGLSLRRMLSEFGLALVVRYPCPSLAPYCWREGAMYPTVALQDRLEIEETWSYDQARALHPLGRLILRLDVGSPGRLRLQAPGRGQVLTLQLLQLQTVGNRRSLVKEAVTVEGVAEILIPMPNSHDEYYALISAPQGAAGEFELSLEALKQSTDPFNPIFLPRLQS